MTRCDELIEYDKRGRSDLLYYEMSRLTRTGKNVDRKARTVNDKNGDLITELDAMKLRWKEYIEDLK